MLMPSATFLTRGIGLETAHERAGRKAPRSSPDVAEQSATPIRTFLGASIDRWGRLRPPWADGCR